jgi:serine/threonine protein kinase
MLGALALGKYRLLRPLGRGSNAEVYLAEPGHEPGRWVVVKRIHDHVVEHPKFRQLFEAEVASMKNFSHPYAVQFLEASIDDPLGPCLVMEYVPGLTLEMLVQRHRALDLERVGRLLGYFCHALQAAHDTGIIHRDLKPANLMVANVGSVKETVKVMDFGFAGFAAKPHIQLAELTGQGPIYAIGTPAYVSPEMIRGDIVGGRSDIYSVGVILYEMLTGRLPFNHYTQKELLSAHVNDSPPRFAEIGVHNIPPAVEATVRLALSKYPNERQQSARELMLMYDQALGEKFWEATTPQGWTPQLPVAKECTPGPRPAPDLPPDPYRITHKFEAMMPERMAAAKIRGFVEDLHGQILSSEPGVILMRLGVPEGYTEMPPATGTGSGILNWFRGRRLPVVANGQEPIELELHVQKPNPSQTRLSVLVAFRPLKDYPPRNAHAWRKRCDKLHVMLRQYMGA